jgi:hypothetical protein
MRYKVDGVILDTDKAQQSWSEATEFDGSNHISRATGAQWDHEELHLSAKGRFYLESFSQRQGSRPSARLVSDSEAAEWLLLMDYEIPQRLEQAAGEVLE